MERRRQEQTPLLEMLNFSGRTALITGSSSGIGRAIVGRFAEANADLMCVDKVPGVDRLGQGAGIKTFHRVNLADKAEIDTFWADIRHPPDILINNVGIYPEQDFLQLTETDFNRVLTINMASATWMCQRFIEQRRGKRGVIVNISSVEAVLPFKNGLIPYSMSKAAVIALSRGLAHEYGKKDIRVNAVLPGAIRTPGTKSLTWEAIKHLRLDLIKVGYDFQQRLAKGRWGDPDEVAKVVLFLSSDLASYLQGAVIPVDGGFLSS